jgi:hypothetical protein
VHTQKQLDARRYADATVEGVCAAGDLRGVEYAMANCRAAPITLERWIECVVNASIAGHSHVVAWVLERSGLASLPSWSHRDNGGDHNDNADHRAIYDVAIKHPQRLLRALASESLVFAQSAVPIMVALALRLRSRFMDLWTHSPEDEKRAVINECRALGGAWLQVVARYDCPTPHSLGIARVEGLVHLDREERAARSSDWTTPAIGPRLAVEFTRDAVDYLTRVGRLDEAASLLSNDWAHTAVPRYVAAGMLLNLAPACARAGRADLLDKLGCFSSSIAPGIVQYEYRNDVWAGTFEAAAEVGRTDILGRMWASAAPFLRASLCESNAVALAVGGGHIDALRWLHDHEFHIADTDAWCPPRSRIVSALTLALVSRRIDMARLIVDSSQGYAAACRAFDEAVADGDLRCAHYIRRTWPWVSAPRPTPAPIPSDPLLGMVLVAHGPQAQDAPPML